MTVGPVAVVPVLVGPLQTLLVMLPALLLSLLGLLVALLRPAAIMAGLRLLWRQKVAVLLFAGGVVGAVFGARTLFPQQGPAIQSEEAGGADWAMFRGDLRRRGAAGAGDGPTRGGLQWCFAADCRTFHATPAVVGNRVYVTSADKGPLRDRGAVYCLDADTGGLVWKSAPPGYLATFSSPAVSGKYLVCGEGLHYTRNARVVCLDLQRGGEVLWTFPTRSHVESSPCISQDRVYVGAGDDGYYCLRLEPDASGEPVLLWHAPAEKYPDAESSPAVHGGRVFVGLGMEGKAVCCLSADTGAEIWRVPTPYPVFAPPTVVGGLVVVGMGNGNFIQSAEQVRSIEIEKLKKSGRSASEIAAAEKLMGPAGEVWCCDAATGEVKWKFAAQQTILGAVAAGEERLYFGSRDGLVYCVSYAGKELARWNAHAPIVTSPALTANHVYVVTETGRLYGLRADDLQPAWEATVGLAGPFLSSPSVARGHVYVGSQQDGMLCLGVPGDHGDEREPIWAGYLGGPGQGGCIDHQPLPEKGKLAWRFPQAAEEAAPPELRTDEGISGGLSQFSSDKNGTVPFPRATVIDSPVLGITAPPACVKQFLYVPVHGGRNGLVCLQDDVKGSAPAREVWFARSQHGVWLSPAASPQSVFFVDGRQADSGRHLSCVAAADGAPRWRLPVAADASGDFVIFDGGGLVVDRAAGLACFTDDGQVTWRASVGAVVGPPAWCETIVIVAVENPPELAALDRRTGKTLWRVPRDELARKDDGPVIRNSTIYVATPQGVAARSLVDGSRRWEGRGGQPAGAMAVGPRRIVYVNEEAELVLISALDGGVERKIPGALPAVPPLVARDAVVYAKKSGLMRYGLTAGEARAWMQTEWLGEFSSPVVMANGRLYFATTKRGLACSKGKQQR